MKITELRKCHSLIDHTCVICQTHLSNHKLNRRIMAVQNRHAGSFEWERISENDRYLHYNHTGLPLNEEFRVRSERNRAYHIRHCDYSIRTNPDETKPYADGYGPIYCEPGRPLQTVLTCCIENCRKQYDRDGVRSHEGFVFHRNVNTLIVYTGHSDSNGNDLYRCANGCTPVEFCKNCNRRH